MRTGFVYLLPDDLFQNSRYITESKVSSHGPGGKKIWRCTSNIDDATVFPTVHIHKMAAGIELDLPVDVFLPHLWGVNAHTYTVVRLGTGLESNDEDV